MAYVYLQSKDGTWYFFVPYVDSGADTSLFPKGDVKMRIGETLLNVNIAFADSDEVPRLLGRSDVFKRFKITFDEISLQTIFEVYE